MRKFVGVGLDAARNKEINVYINHNNAYVYNYRNSVISPTKNLTYDNSDLNLGLRTYNNEPYYVLKTFGDKILVQPVITKQYSMYLMDLEQFFSGV